MLAFHSNVSNFKNILPKPPRICPWSESKQAGPCFHVTCAEVRVANLRGMSDSSVRGKPSQQSCPVSCPSGSPATRQQGGLRMGREQELIRKDSSGLYLHLLEGASGYQAVALTGASRCFQKTARNPQLVNLLQVH